MADLRAALVASGRCSVIQDLAADDVVTFELPGNVLLDGLSCIDTEGEEVRFQAVTSVQARGEASSAALDAGYVFVIAGWGDSLWYAVTTSEELVSGLLEQKEYVHVAEPA
ncbi:hypothetical protein [Auraticoccus monumenti]|uniref:hypothetical protein n=1 Tax=Auraticoccus monumenti TaxID=675864 RepID=UPI000B82AD5D|nr:hypothetical protein [Auraticoccus monumenti]